MTTLVLTAIGDDRTGLVTALSDIVAVHGGNWERSQMAELAGKFAGIVMVTVPDRRADDLIAELAVLRERGLLDVRAERATIRATAGTRRVTLGVVGTDRPGIVREISRALADRGISIDELQTVTRDAPMAGGTLFEASAVLDVPHDVSIDQVRAALEALADELMVDVELSAD